MLSSPLIENNLIFNLSIYGAHERNRWKFLEEIDLEPGKEAGPLLSSPYPVLTLTGSYVLFVCFIGPILMKNREPFQLKTPIRFYNLLMVLLAAILFYKVYDAVESFESFFNCRTAFSFSDASGTKVYRHANFILAVRLSEYLDTIFFTLRKKQNQVTFLHVFHHAFVPIYAYWILRTAPLRFNVYIILVNSFIHVLMYSYYFLATFQQQQRVDPATGKRLSPAQRPSFVMMVVQKVLLFKRYMTQLQILQFVSLGIYGIWAALQPNFCNIPGTYILSNLLLAFGFLGLFVHFYLSVYKAGARTAAATKSRRD